MINLYQLYINVLEAYDYKRTIILEMLYTNRNIYHILQTKEYVDVKILGEYIVKNS